MQKKWIVIIIIFVLLVLIAYYFSRDLDSTSEKQKENLAKCLSEKGIALYILDGCTHCTSQKEDFGEAVQYLNIISCSETPNQCSGITSVPSWKINEAIIKGRQSFEKLAEISGCPYP